MPQDRHSSSKLSRVPQWQQSDFLETTKYSYRRGVRRAARISARHRRLRHTQRGTTYSYRFAEEPGIYGLFDSAMRVLYYGKATSLYAEVRQTLGRKVGEVRPWTGAKNLTFHEVAAYLSAYRIIRGDAKYVHDVEAFGLRFLVNNTFNKNGGVFKRTE